MKVEGETTISAADAAQVIATLNAQIASLNSYIQQERASEEQRAAVRVRDAVLGLRRLGVILLHNGENSAQAIAQMASDNPVMLAAFEQAWNLERAPLPQPVISQLKEVTAGGMNRF
ncbi:MAG: hypothetical protein EKK53_04825 [Burkholderiales bacterium]|nr:MAG: hypothetical protein EKK53_04825 [Burkholderiales bacterium]